MELIELPVRDGYLEGVPSDDVGPLVIPFNEGTCWCATVTGKPKEMERHWWVRPRPRRDGLLYFVPAYARPGVVVEFGVNHRNPEPPRPAEAAAAPPDGFAASIAAPSKRRWYGVIRDLSLDDRRNGRLSLLPTDDFSAALKLAPAVEYPVPAEQLRAFLSAARSGDMGAVMVFADWLEEHDDPRGHELRAGWVRFINDLFPEIPEPEKKDKK